jgi:hypothetical protein
MTEKTEAMIMMLMMATTTMCLLTNQLTAEQVLTRSTSYDSQGQGGGILTRLQASKLQQLTGTAYNISARTA